MCHRIGQGCLLNFRSSLVLWHPKPSDLSYFLPQENLPFHPQHFILPSWSLNLPSSFSPLPVCSAEVMSLGACRSLSGMRLPCFRPFSYQRGVGKREDGKYAVRGERQGLSAPLCWWLVSCCTGFVAGPLWNVGIVVGWGTDYLKFTISLLLVLLVSLLLEAEGKEADVKYVVMVLPFNRCLQISSRADCLSIGKHETRVFLKIIFCLAPRLLCLWFWVPFLCLCGGPRIED